MVPPYSGMMIFRYSRRVLYRDAILRTVSSMLVCLFAVSTFVFLLHLGMHDWAMAVAVISFTPLLTIIYVLLVWRRARSEVGVEITTEKDLLITTILHWRHRLLVPANQIRGLQIRERGKNRFLLVQRYYANSIILNAKDFEEDDAIDNIRRNLDKGKTESFEIPFPMLTSALGVAMLVIFFLSSHEGNPFHIQSMLSLGAWYSPGLETADAYRAISYAFLHKNWIHIFQNLIALGVLGAAVEHVWFTTRFLAIFAVASVAGAIASYAFYDYSIVVGASAGIYGLLGSYVFLRLFRLGSYKERFLSLSNKVLWFIIVVDILGALVIKNIDLVAHIAGFVAGFVYAAVLDSGKGWTQWLRWLDASVLVVAAGLLIQAGYFYVSWTPKDTLKIARIWLNSGLKTAVNQGAWMIAVTKHPPRRDVSEAINRLKHTSLEPESRDTLATLYAREGDLSRAISLERAVIKHHETSAFVSQLVRFERKARHVPSDNWNGVRLPNVPSQSSVDAVCNETKFLRFNVTSKLPIDSQCIGRFEIISIRHGKERPMTVKLDPAVLALPL